MTQEVALRFGDIQLAGEIPPATDYLIETMADGTHLGNPKSIREFVKSLFVDGSLSVLQGTDNREPELYLRVSAPAAIAGPALAEAERVLTLATRVKPRPAPLVYVPPATDAATTVFDVEAADLNRDTGAGWDLEEELREYRYFTLSLSCWPWVRPEKTVIVPAIPVPPDPTTPPVVTDVDTCDSAAGWTYTSGRWNMGTSPALAVSAGAVVASGPVKRFGSAPPPSWFTVERPGAISFTGTPYLRVTATVTGGTSPSFSVLGVGPLVQAVPNALIPGAIDYFYEPSATSMAALDFVATGDPALPDGATITLQVHHIARQDKLPAIAGTPRQQSRLATITGAAPTQASIRLYDATPAALGSDILVYTSQNTTWQPPLRKWLTSGGAVADTSMVSGGKNTMGSAMTFRIPANLLTEGTYSLLAKMNVTVAGTLTWSTRIVSSSGAATIGSSLTDSGSIALGVTGGHRVLNLAAMLLPPVATEGNQLVELVLTGTANMTFDEGWLCSQTDGVLTWIPDTDSLSWIEIRSPEIGSDRPTIYGGTGAFGTNPACIDWKTSGNPAYGASGQHITEPGRLQVFTVCTGSLVSQSELEFYEHYHSHVIDEAA